MDVPPMNPQDKDEQISIRRSEEIQFWCDQLGCSATQLGNAIGQVGYSAERVRALLAAERQVRESEPPAGPGSKGRPPP